MKNENAKYLILPILMVLGFVAWYYWHKSKMVLAAFASQSTETTTAATTDTATPTIAASSEKVKFYPYGMGGVFFSDRDPSTYKSVELLNFTPNLATQSAFKSN